MLQLDIETRAAINAMLSFALFCVLVAFGLDMKVPYPRQVIIAFSRPMNRALCYICLYVMAYYNPIISILMFMCITLLHTDYVNMVGSNTS